MATISVGTNFANGKYRIERELGSGSFGTVWLVMNQRLNRHEAMKVLNREDLDVSGSLYDRARSRFRLEAEVGARVKHSNVIEVFDHDERDGLLYMTMEFAPMGSLADLLRRERMLAVDQVVLMLQQICSGVQALHDQANAIHRDIKPSNILVVQDDVVKIADLGLAQVQGSQSSDRDRDGSVASPHPGTPDYMSPEHAARRSLTSTSDVYSVGCVAFELLTGKVWAREQGYVEKPSVLRPQVPAWLDTIVVRMLNPLPGMRRSDANKLGVRYVSMDDVLAALLRQGAPTQRTRLHPSSNAARTTPTPVPTQLPAQPIAEPPKPTATPVQISFPTAADAIAPKRAPVDVAGLDKRRIRITSTLHIDVVRIPVGPFMMGSDRSTDRNSQTNEQPAHSVRLETFWLAVHPITNRQFGEFVAATGHRTQAEEDGASDVPSFNGPVRTVHADWLHPRGPQSDLTERAEHPVTHVSWNDAQAFVRWANDCSKLKLRLPSEAEWEKAARGHDGRIYPWGNSRSASRSRSAMSVQSVDTAPVGAAGADMASFYGVQDMAGTVWQWTRSIYRPYPYAAADGREASLSFDARTLRGGSFHLSHLFSRSAFRNFELPNHHAGDVGFRICLSE